MKNLFSKHLFKLLLLAILIIFSTAVLCDAQDMSLAEKSEIITANTGAQAFASADTTVQVTPIEPFPAGEGIPAIIAWLMQYWNVFIENIMVLVLVLEAIVRAIPTSSNWSFLQKIAEWLDKVRLFRNRKSGGGRFVAKTEVED